MVGHTRTSLFLLFSSLFLNCSIQNVSSLCEKRTSIGIGKIDGGSGKNLVLKLPRGGDDDADNEVVEDDAETETKEEEEEEESKSSAEESTTKTDDDDNNNDEEEEGESLGSDSTNQSTIEAIEDEQNEEVVDPTELRLRGKEFHDEGDFVKAAEVFKIAADSIIQKQQQGRSEIDENSEMDDDEEYVTCRLHEALCHLKCENYEDCIRACSDVLGDTTTAEATNSQAATTTITTPKQYSPAVRARAYHRRAKAKLALEDASGALQDARSAAFLGDRRAVAFYGKLMRESSPFSIGGDSDSSGSSLQDLPSSSSALLESILGKSNGSSPSAMPDLSSLLLGGNNSDGGGGGGGGNSMLLDALKSSLGGGGKGSGGGAGGASLAKSVMESLYKRLDDESTQTKISGYLQSANKQQLEQLASMAGIPNTIQDQHLDRVLGICHGVTPKTIRKTVRYSKRAVYVTKLMRRISRIINKYKTILVAIMLFQWSKSACLRPMPVDRRATRRAAKQAIKDAMKNNRK